MAAHASSGSGGSGGPSATTSSLGTASAGDLVVVTLSWYSGTFSSITDNATGNTWTQIGSEQNLGFGSGVQVRSYYSVLTNGGSLFTVTGTLTGGGTFPSISGDRFNGATGWTLDQTAQAAPGSAATSGSSGATSTRSSANEVMVGCFAHGGVSDITITPGTNVAWTAGGSYPSGSVAVISSQEYFLASSAGTQGAEFSWTESNAWGIKVATFSYSGGTTPTASRITLLGVGR